MRATISTASAPAWPILEAETWPRIAAPSLLVLRAEAGGEILACAMIERIVETGGRVVGYIGMVTVKPDLQAGGVGRVMLAAAEDHARAFGAARARMTVVSIRDTLIAWYERRGYHLTGETRPFPYGDDRFGVPRVPDLEFVVLEKGVGRFARPAGVLRHGDLTVAAGVHGSDAQKAL